jgi:hypothetical protein
VGKSSKKSYLFSIGYEQGGAEAGPLARDAANRPNAPDGLFGRAPNCSIAPEHRNSDEISNI